MNRLSIYWQERRITSLEQQQRDALAAAGYEQAHALEIGQRLVAASLQLAQMQGHLPARTPTPAKRAIRTQSAVTSLLFGREGGFSSLHQGWMFAGIAACAVVGSLLADWLP